LDEAGFCGRAIHGGLMVQLNPELRGIVALSLGVSLTASICAFVIGSLFGAALATRVT
jgi:ABC-type tungstate transport system substrate-binding protein